MSIQDKILRANDPIKRKLYDNKIKFSGNASKVIRLVIEEDRHGDETLVELTSHSEIIVDFANLEEIPLSRLRKDLTSTAVTSQESLYLYDVLPILIRPQFDDVVYKNDIIIKKLYDDRFEDQSFYLTLRVTETVGSFSPISLTSVYYQTAPIIQIFSQDIIDIIESY